jgi:hypothetical protein
MFHIVLIFIVVALVVMGWQLVLSAPRVLSLLLPVNIVFTLGAVFFIASTYSAFMDAFALQRPAGMLDGFVSMLVGMWFMFAGFAGLRGHPSHDDLVRRVAAMTGVMFAVIVASLYVNDAKAVALLELGMVASGYWLARDYLQRSGR